ncbi:MAG: hypothetical protein K2X87_11475, partial [Gemmataceae bacterium]|nr:hypothetical protein [Gemmataceae bacterium]
VRRVVEARLRPCLDELPPGEPATDITPFAEEQVVRIAATEPTLRDMLQQLRHLFDHVVYGPDDFVQGPGARGQGSVRTMPAADADAGTAVNRIAGVEDAPPAPPQPPAANRVAALLEGPPEDAAPPIVKSVEVVQHPAGPPPEPAVPAGPVLLPHKMTPIGGPFPGDPPSDPVFWDGHIPLVPIDAGMPPNPHLPTARASEAAPEVPPSTFPAPGAEPELVDRPRLSAPPKGSAPTHTALVELWDQEHRAARRKLEPDGALTGATRELQAGLGAFLALCHEHGVKVGPWRLQHVVPEWGFGDHPTYGVVTLAHWACGDGQPWKVGVGLFLARGAGKPKDLEVKLGVTDVQPAVVDHLILLRPEDDLGLSGKSKILWQDAERRGKHARLEAAALDGFARLYSFPRWLAAVRESLPEGAPLPNLADVIQEQCEKLLEQVCMPVQG